MAEIAECYVCGGRHEVTMFGGVRFLGCPSVPEGYLVPGPEAWRAALTRAFPGAAPTTRGAACPVPNCHAGMLRDHDGRDSVSCPVCDGRLPREQYESHAALAARGDETAPAGPAAAPPLAGFVVAEPCAYEFTRKPSSPPPSGGARGIDLTHLQPGLTSMPAEPGNWTAPAPTLSETPAKCRCPHGVALGPNGEARRVGDLCHTGSEGCYSLGAPAAPSGAGDAGCAGEDHDATQIHDCPTKETPDEAE
jgi:hypothetical protein